MRIILTCILSICVANLSGAQATDLYLTNNAGTYIYVDGTGFDDTVSNEAPLYVENRIFIGRNANIYLRDGAQLLQNNETAFNRNHGKLSIYQSGTVHNYAYNYWCSPVGNTEGSNSINRPFRADNVMYDVTAAPITSSTAGFTSGLDGTSSPLVISSRWLYTYDPGALYSEWDYLGETGYANTGYGFTMKGTSGSGNNQLYDFRGKPNTGTIGVDVAPPVGPDPQWTLVGNPYPSALDVRDFIHDGTNSTRITGILYFWEQDLSVNSHYLVDYVGGYASYTINSAGTTETFTPATFDTYNGDGTLNTMGSPSTSGKRVYRYIPVGQGFMIEGTTTNQVFFRNSHRNFVKQAATASEFFEPNNNNDDPRTRNADMDGNVIQYNDMGLSIVPEDHKRFRLNLDFDDVYTRQLVQTFANETTVGVDYGYDAKSPPGPKTDASWIINDLAYVAQAMPFDHKLKIPLSINLEENMSLRFRIFDIQNFNSEAPIYIHDKISNLYVNLRQQNYEVNLEAGSYNDRFEITFENEDTLGEEDVLLQDLKIYQNNSKSQLTILNPNNLDFYKVAIFDMAGRQILNKDGLSNQPEYYFSTRSFGDGTYIVMVELLNKQINKKIIVKNN